MGQTSAGMRALCVLCDAHTTASSFDPKLTVHAPSTDPPKRAQAGRGSPAAGLVAYASLSSKSTHITPHTMGNPDTTTTTTGAATTTGPSAGRLKKTIRAVLEAGNYDPSLTFGQIRAKVAAQLQPKHPSFDFASPAFRAESKAVVAALIDEWQQQKQQQPQKQQQSAGTVTANDDAGGSNKRAAPQEEEDEQERRRRKKEKKKAKAMAAAPTAAPSSDPSDPVYKRLAKMAQVSRVSGWMYGGIVAQYVYGPKHHLNNQSPGDGARTGHLQGPEGDRGHRRAHRGAPAAPGGQGCVGWWLIGWLVEEAY